MEDKIIAGLDIGSTKICAVVGRMNPDETLEILGIGKCPCEGVEKGVIANLDLTVDAIRIAKQEAENQSGIDIQVVNAGIAGKHIRTQQEFGIITRESDDDVISVSDINRLATDMYRIVTPAGTEIIHVIPQEYTVNFQNGIKDPVGRRGIKLGADFNIITAHTEAVSNLKRCLKVAGLVMENLMLESIAAGMSVLNKEEKNAGVAIVDIGGDTTEIAIYHDNILRYTGAVPFGGNVISKDIRNGCIIQPQQAEMLKVKYGKALAEKSSPYDVVVIQGIRGNSAKEISVHNLSQIIQARAEEIVEWVFTELVKSNYHKKLGAGIVLTGGGANLQFLKELFELHTGIPTRIGNPSEYLNLSNQYLGHLKKPEYATATGLVLAGFRALDERENRYLKTIRQGSGTNHKTSQKVNVTSKSLFSKPEKPETEKKNFFNDFFKKARNFLMDDVESQDEY
jgi:cell division protein FtsA